MLAWIRGVILVYGFEMSIITFLFDCFALFFFLGGGYVPIKGGFPKPALTSSFIIDNLESAPQSMHQMVP